MTCDFTIPPFFPLTEYVWLQDFFYATRLLLCYCLVSGDDFWTYCENIRYIYSLPLLKLHYSQVFSTFSYYHQNTNFNRKCTGKKTFVIGLVALVIISIIQDFLTLSAKKFFCLLCLFYCLVAILIMLLAGLYLSNYFFFLLLFRYFLFCYGLFG